MPLYVYECSLCGHVQEELIPTAESFVKCEFCGNRSVRDFSKETVNVRGDIEPGYNESLGQHIGSRRELREALAFHNAASPELMINSYPSAGRLTKEERTEVADSTIFDKRNRPGWDSNPTDIDDGVSVVGKADYTPIVRSIRRQHKSPSERKARR